MATKHKVTVHIRVRPLSLIEASSHDGRSVVLPNAAATGLVVDATDVVRGAGASSYRKTKTFEGFGHVYGPLTSQQDVFSRSVHAVVDGAFQGINGSVLAYGATGSGKTHTMFGYNTVDGVIPQAARALFERKLDLERIGRSVSLQFALYEVYMDKIRDLSSDALPATAGGLKILQGEGASADIQGLQWLELRDFADFKRWVDTGMHNRCHAATVANEHSSRSHAILNIRVVVRDPLEPQCTYKAHLKFCDLAGSERAASNQNKADRFKEGCNINSGLLALSNVVHALAAAPSGKKVNVSFRASPLTRVLQDCISGNVRSCMIVCVSPSLAHKDETINALQFAQHAANIECKVSRNQGDSMADLQALNVDLCNEVARLKRELVSRRPLTVDDEERPLTPPRKVDRATEPVTEWEAEYAARLSQRNSTGGSASASTISAASLHFAGSPDRAAQQPIYALDVTPTRNAGGLSPLGKTSDPLAGEPWASYLREFDELVALREPLDAEMRNHNEATQQALSRDVLSDAWTVIKYYAQPQATADATLPVGIATLLHKIDKLQPELARMEAAHKAAESKKLAISNRIDALIAKVRCESDSKAVGQFLMRSEMDAKSQLVRDSEFLSQYYHATSQLTGIRNEKLQEALVRQSNAIESLVAFVDRRYAAALSGEASSTSVEAVAAEIAALKCEAQIAQAYAAAAAAIRDPRTLVDEFRSRSRNLKLSLHNVVQSEGLKSVRLDLMNLSAAASIQRRRVAVPPTPTWAARAAHHATYLDAMPSEADIRMCSFPEALPYSLPGARPMARVRPNNNVARPRAVGFAADVATAPGSSGDNAFHRQHSSFVAPSAVVATPVKQQQQSQAAASSNAGAAPLSAADTFVSQSPVHGPAPPHVQVALGVTVPARLTSAPAGGVGAGLATSSAPSVPPMNGSSSQNTSTSSTGTCGSATFVQPSKLNTDFGRTNTSTGVGSGSATAGAGKQRGLLRGSAASFHRTATSTSRVVERNNKENAAGSFR